MMAERYKEYPNYKNSGVDWIGIIPNHWTKSSIKRIFKIVNGSTPKSGEPKFWDGAIVWVTPADLSKVSETISNSSKKITESGLSSCGTSIVPSGSIVLSTRAPIGSLAITATPLCTNQGCKTLVANKNNKFEYHVLSISGNQLNDLGRGTTFLELSSDALANYCIPVPSVEEQQNIANFLDYETAKIDTLIAKQEKLIELLKEKRQAVISHAVTRGLNTDAPMKDSGVEWLGEVPEHWKVKRFKFLCDSIIAGPFGSSITKDMYVKEGFKVYGQEQVIPNNFDIGDYFISESDFNSLSRYQAFPNDLLISCVGTFGKISVFPKTAETGIINPRLIKATLKSEFDSYFVREFLKSETVFKQFELLSRGGTMGVINIAILNEIFVATPPIDEQLQIYKFITVQKNKFKLLISKCETQIKLSKERKIALISSAVTGKIDVRNWSQV